MKIKVGQKVRIGKSAKCLEALKYFYLSDERQLASVLNRIAFIRKITEFTKLPAVHLNFPGQRPKDPYSIRRPDIYFPVSVLKKP